MNLDYIKQHRERYTTPPDKQLIPGQKCPRCGGLIRETYGKTVKWHIYHECPYCGERERRYDRETPQDSGKRAKDSRKRSGHAMVASHGKFLLLRKSYGNPNHWHCPGGMAKHGERRADADAVIICLPKDHLPSPLLSCEGLRPEYAVNDKTAVDTIHRIRELGGMYERADANGTFTLQYHVGVRYVVMLISAHQMRSGGILKPSVLQELRRYFQNPEVLSEHCLHVDEYDWSDYSLRHTFESEVH
jgi:hypothetical protein